MAQHVSARGRAEIISHEAMVLSPYRDSKGVWTIFVGHTAGAGAPYPDRMDKGAERPIAEGMAVFERDIERFEARVRRAFSRPLTQKQFDAATSFDFNTGAIDRASWVKKFNAGDDAGAKKAFMNWCKPPEIADRRRRERDLFFSGRYSGDGKMTVYPASASGKVLWNKGRRVAIPAMPDSAAPQPAPASKPKPKTDHILRRGAKGEYVLELQKHLVALGYGPLVADGDFGKATEAAVKAFQQDHGLKADGWAGNRTQAAIGKALAAKAAAPKIRAAERKAEEAADKVDRAKTAVDEAETKARGRRLPEWMAGIGTIITSVSTFLSGLDWMTVLAVVGAGIVVVALIVVFRAQFIAAFRDVRAAVEDPGEREDDAQ